MQTSVRISVKGIVQGVSFRKHTLRVASSLGVNGWVRNLPDGSVEARLEGDQAAVEALLAWCSAGPERARVDELIVAQEDFLGLYQDFQIRTDEPLAA